MIARMVVGLALTVIVLAIAGRRVLWLYKLISSGQPAHDRSDQLGARLRTQFVEVLGQRKLLQWSIPGLAHLFTMWAFIILLSVYIEAYGALFDEKFAIPFIGHWAALGLLQDFIAVMVLISLVVFAIIRVRNAPEREHRASRFYGSHTGPAWFVLFMIFNVVWTLFFFRGVESAAGNFPYTSGAYVSIGIGDLFSGLSAGTLAVLEAIGLILHIGVMLAFLILVLYSKHLHIFVAPINVAAKRLPKALGPLLPMESNGKPIDFEDPNEDDTFGRGKIEDFTWKGMLDFATCTECGRCQSQCPAWNTGKPLSPKLVIMDLRDHLFAKAPYLIGGKEAPEEGSVEVEGHEHDGHGVPESGFARVEGSGEQQAARPLVGTLEAGGVIDPDVLWSCTSCGACVEQCPVDIEHVDHIIDMRRHQVMIESEFPTELGVLFRNLENKGNPWGQNNKERLDWTKGLDFEVPVFSGELSIDTEYLYWIGCAGAFDDNAKKTVKATAELLHRAGVNYVVLGTDEGCTGDPARRSGNEFLFQMMAQQNVEMLNTVFEGREPGKRKIVTTCPHCMNTLGREYPQLDGHYEVVHHTQLLNKLVRDGRLVPVAAPEGGQDVTFHDPCYLGRHNGVYEAPRELVGAAGAKLTEMPRHAERSMCCGAGGARMWMEEKIGKRVNLARTEEALATEAKQIATGCPFCRVMLTDGLTEKQNDGAGEDVEVLDVSQLLLASVKRGDDQASGKHAKAEPTKAEPTKAEPTAEPEPAKAAEPDKTTETTDKPEPAKSEQAAEPEKPEPAKSAEADKAEADKAEADKAEADKAEADKAEADKAEADKAEADKAEADKAEADKAEADKAEADKAEADKAEADKAEADKAEADKAEADKAEADKAEADKAEADKAEADKAEADKAEADKAEADKAEADKAEADKAEADKAEADKAEADKATETTAEPATETKSAQASPATPATSTEVGSPEATDDATPAPAETNMSTPATSAKPTPAEAAPAGESTATEEPAAETAKPTDTSGDTNKDPAPSEAEVADTQATENEADSSPASAESTSTNGHRNGSDSTNEQPSAKPSEPAATPESDG